MFSPVQNSEFYLQLKLHSLLAQVFLGQATCTGKGSVSSLLSPFVFSFLIAHWLGYLWPLQKCRSVQASEQKGGVTVENVGLDWWSVTKFSLLGSLDMGSV